jgi:hypothetical protein
MRRIYGPVMDNNIWSIGYSCNEEMNALFINSQIIRWLGHVERIEDTAMLKRIIKGKWYSIIRNGRHRMRWLYDHESDLKITKVKGWKEKMRDREYCGLVVDEAMVHQGL